MQNCTRWKAAEKEVEAEYIYIYIETAEIYQTRTNETIKSDMGEGGGGLY